MNDLIETRQLSRLDANTGSVLLHPTDYRLNGGDRVAITGPSGSGKSVFLRALALLDAPSRGELLFKGHPVAPDHVPAYRSRVCYIAQKPGLLDGTVADNLRYPYGLKVFAKARFDLPTVQRLLAQAGKPAAFLDKHSADLSGGEAQVLALVRVLQLDPDVLLLDEPTAALDPASAAQVEQLVGAWFGQAPGTRAYLWVSHDPQQAQRVSNRQLNMIAGALA
ncbi:MAG: ATP-binding cassette domain-containing protein [Pseudomonas sp.]|uniref:ABC transporter ATP-binding protein n=1 Tax=Pseudomonas abieticivorans TaxID=2931382 RepID=UPI0020BF7FCB|nr:ATP-binding cassette domain-containing protein [Pseudomonas sp. PIA16]MDE1164671.1 ATP-binding cassette domain-containing protein [Pseudomonas sp.]